MVKAAAALLLCFLTAAQAAVYFQEKFDGAADALMSSAYALICTHGVIASPHSHVGEAMEEELVETVRWYCSRLYVDRGAFLRQRGGGQGHSDLH